MFKHTTLFEITVYEVSERNSYLFNTYKNVTEINQLISVESCSKSAVLMCVPQINFYMNTISNSNVEIESDVICCNLHQLI